MRTSSTGRRAFTLVEVLVVIVIVAVLATMTVPRMVGAFGASPVRTSAQGLLLGLRYARDFAVTHRCACRLVLDANEHRYAIEYQEDPEHRPDRFVPVSIGIGKGDRLAEGVRFGRVRIESTGRRDADVHGIVFHPSGAADAAIVELTDGRRTVSLVVIGSSGRAVLVDGTVRRLPNDRQDLDV